MSTPNPKDPKKPTAGASPAVKKPDAAKPAGQPTVKAAPKPAPAKADAAAKPAASAKPTAEKAAPKKKEKTWSTEGGSRKIGQIMVDLGFIDEGQLWDILEEARTNGVRVGQVALGRGLVNDD